MMGETKNPAHRIALAFAIMKKKRPSSQPKVGVAPLDGKTPLFGSPAASLCWPVALRPQVTLGLSFRKSYFVNY